MATFIKYVENGLPENTILYSEESHLQWKVKHRMLWMHSVDAVTRFSNEKENTGHVSFKYTLNYEDQVKHTAETELNLGFEYLIQPVNHSEKPQNGEYLIIQT